MIIDNASQLTEAVLAAVEGTPDARLRRFMGTRSGRKLRYGGLLVEALQLDHVPRPLDRLLAHVTSTA